MAMSSVMLALCVRKPWRFADDTPSDIAGARRIQKRLAASCLPLDEAFAFGNRFARIRLSWEAHALEQRCEARI